MAGHVTARPDHYLVHRRSVVSAEDFAAHVAHVDGMLAGAEIRGETGGYPGPVGPSRRLGAEEVTALGGDAAVAGWAVPEYSVDTQWLVDWLAEAVAATRGIALRTGRSVTGLESASGGFAGPWRVALEEGGVEGGFDLVVNVLWENRLWLDRALGLSAATGWSHRFRKSLFLRSDHTFDLPSRVFAIGRLGDLKNHDGRRFYVSRYPAGPVAEGHAVRPPEIAGGAPDATVLAETRVAIERLAPDKGAVFAAAEDVKVEGGRVFAQGAGRLDDPKATIHRRDRYGITRQGSYVRVDTGKFSTAPDMAARLAADILG